MPKRALILAGGGLKVAFQAGVLQVWLDEAGLQFDHADGASGGCFNLAMYCQGFGGTRIADNWRTLDPFLPVDLNAGELLRLGQAESLFTYDNFRRRVLPSWGIDWTAIRQSARTGTFNLFNFSKKRLEVVTADQMDEDRLISAVSLPMWFPPVAINGDTYIDAVYITDANVEEAIRRGADELWAIWTVSTRDEWRSGFLAQYFHIIEAVADTRFFSAWRRIEASNAAIAAGGTGEFGRPIALKLIQAEVPLHYLFNFSRDRMAEAVNLGVTMARDWCDREGIPLPHRGGPVPPPSGTPRSTLQFTEEMKGFAALGATDPAAGAATGQQTGHPLGVQLTIAVDDVDRFLADPAHEAAVNGWVESDLIGGRRLVAGGTFNLLVHDTDPSRKQMRYRLPYTGSDGRKYLLSGAKEVYHDGQLDLWTDTTTLFFRLLDGWVLPADEATAMVKGAGIIAIQPLDFLRQLTTFRVDGPTPAARLDALTRFGEFFLGKLWDVYARQIIDVGPF
jgi:predicted patatin/cPLA2 family phospholipase